MKLYSDTLTESDIRRAADGTGVYLEVRAMRSPRVRRYGWDIDTYGNTNRWKNSGKGGAGSNRAATWDQHGAWMANLFTLDPHAVVVAAGRYDGAVEFAEKTGGKYVATVA